MRTILESIEAKYREQKALADAAMAQLSDAQLVAPGPGGGSSIAVIARHLGGNLASRFTDFLTSDGEKPWRDRESEFAPRAPSRGELVEHWERGWSLLAGSLAELTDADLERAVVIRGVSLSVVEALHRSLAHACYHVGQIVYVAKAHRGADWKYLSIPPGGSEAYRRNPTAERAGENAARLAAGVDAVAGGGAGGGAGPADDRDARPTNGRVLSPHAIASRLDLRNVAASTVTYRGRRAIRLVGIPNPAEPGPAIAIVPDVTFRDGVIETSIAGAPLAGAPAAMRGFVGIAFRVRDGGARFECVYLRPTNGRAEDQLRRNHATQYVSHPDYPWQRLREETPGVYESYVDLEPGAWTDLRIVVSGDRASLYAHGAPQPCLVVNDLKLGAAASGGIALWIGSGTEGHFSDIVVR